MVNCLGFAFCVRCTESLSWGDKGVAGKKIKLVGLLEIHLRFVKIKIAEKQTRAALTHAGALGAGEIRNV